MANKKRGYYTIKMGGKNRTMHFSMNFWSNFTDDLNIPLDKLGEIFTDGVSLSTVRSLIYSAMLANDQENKNLIDYDKFDVGVWMDDLQADDLDKIVAAMMESRILGNDLNAGMSRNVKKSTKGK
tara:strand:+ start:1018 stop:1392 length:375 start_codon:yes stop_codon:yes gene_type:complete